MNNLSIILCKTTLKIIKYVGGRNVYYLLQNLALTV